MKQRITYLLPEGSGASLADIEVRQSSLTYKGAGSAAKEHRITAGLSELPEELRLVLEDCHELHIRWSSPQNFENASPLVSRIPPGLHIFFTPRKADIKVKLCPLIQTLFGHSLKCHSVEESFSRPPILSERFAASSTWQYFHSLPDLKRIESYAQFRLCRPPGASPQLSALCSLEATALAEADSFDIDYDAISHAATFNAYSSAPSPDKELESGPATAGANRSIEKRRQQDSVEVGVLASIDPAEPEELSMSGYLTVIGEDSKPSATQIDFPSRHHPLPLDARAMYLIEFPQPTGLHPKMIIKFARQTLLPPKDKCALHAYLTLPSYLFMDRYQFSDPLFLQSQNLVALRALSGEQDLEAPEWVTKSWGSAALLELSRPSTGDSLNGSWDITIPLHLRYLAPHSNATVPGYDEVHVPWPNVFWACDAEEGLKMSVNPFDRVNLGYDGLFGSKTMFYHLPAEDNASLLETIKVPTLDPRSAGMISTGTVFVVVAGFVWVMWQLIRSATPSDKGAKQKKTQ